MNDELHSLEANLDKGIMPNYNTALNELKRNASEPKDAFHKLIEQERSSAVKQTWPPKIVKLKQDETLL